MKKRFNIRSHREYKLSGISTVNFRKLPTASEVRRANANLMFKRSECSMIFYSDMPTYIHRPRGIR